MEKKDYLAVTLEQRRANIHLETEILVTLVNRGLKTSNNGNFTINMVHNWFYGRNNNETIEQVFRELCQKEPA